MTKSNVYILFGNQKSIDNYLISATHLIETTTAVAYMVDAFKASEINESEKHQRYLKAYEKFHFISKNDFDLIHHALLKKARIFMKNNT